MSGGGRLYLAAVDGDRPGPIRPNPVSKYEGILSDRKVVDAACRRYRTAVDGNAADQTILERESGGIYKPLNQEHSTNPTKPESYEGFRDIVRQERMIELALEGQRFWDLRRWDIAVEYLNKPMLGWDIEQDKTEDYNKLRTYYIRNYSYRDNLWPLKDYDLIVNPKLEQNPGW